MYKFSVAHLAESLHDNVLIALNLSLRQEHGLFSRHAGSVELA